MNMKTVKVHIHQDSSCAWCELNDGQMLYAKDAEELQQTLGMMSAYSKQQYELAGDNALAVSCNNIA